MEPTDAGYLLSAERNKQAKFVIPSAQAMSQNWRKLKEILDSNHLDADANSGRKNKRPCLIKGKVLKKNKKKKKLEKVGVNSLIFPQVKNAMDSRISTVSASTSTETAKKLSYASVVMNRTAEKERKVSEKSYPADAESCVNSTTAPNLTKCLAIDCEFVGVGPRRHRRHARPRFDRQSIGRLCL